MDIWQTLVNAVVVCVVLALLYPIYKALLRRRERRQADIEAWRRAEDAEWRARQERGE